MIFGGDVMKRIISIILVIVLLTGTAYALYCEKALFPIFVNGEELKLTDPPLAYNGRSYLPIKAISEAVGVSAEWKNNRVEIETLDIEALKNSCVMVYAGETSKAYTKQASGVLIDYDEVLTVNHVTEGRSYCAVVYDDSDLIKPCQIIDQAPAKDAAVLAPAEKTVKPVQIGDSDTVKVGDKVYVISCPDGKKNEVTSGGVIEAGTFNGMVIFVTDAFTDNGSSGGAVFNSGGELIGLIIGGSDETKMSYFAPINIIRKSLAA